MKLPSNYNKRRVSEHGLEVTTNYMQDAWYDTMSKDVPMPFSTMDGDKLLCPGPFSRLRVEKIEGGLMVAGVVVAANCQIILPIFGFLFLLIGTVLTATSYRGPAEDEDADDYAARLEFTENARIVGPVCIVIGSIMLLGSVMLCLLTKRVKKKEQTIGFHCPLHGDFYPLSPFSSSRTAALGTCRKNSLMCFSKRRGPGTVAVAPPHCPHSQVSSTRSSFVSVPFSQCPTPQPFLIASGTAGGILTPAIEVSSDHNFGSIRSLSVSREVASFPISRTPTPPPTSSERPSSSLLHVEEGCSTSASPSVGKPRLPPLVHTNLKSAVIVEPAAEIKN